MQRDIYLDKTFVLDWVKRKEPLSKRKKCKKTLRFIDLFSGCGGLSLGIESAGRELGIKTFSALAIDSEKKVTEVYEKNIAHEDGSVLHTDILKAINYNKKGRLTKKEITLKESIGEIDILVAGPPCQGHSDLNNSTRRNDPRNKLYLSCIRAIEIFEPDLVLIENVPSVIHSIEGVVQSTEQRLEKLNYQVKHLDVDFLNLGIPQTRKRHVLVASKNKEFCQSLSIIKASKQKPKLKEFISDVKETDGILHTSGKLSKDNIQRVDYLFNNKLYDLPNSQRPPCHRDKKHSYNSVYGRLNYNLPAQTITSGFGSMGQGRYIHPTKKRTINPREALRIQGFPDYFDFSPIDKITDLRKMIANAVPPQLSYIICHHYMKDITRKKP